LNGKTINIDGKLDDDAWQEVPWTETFTGNNQSQCSEKARDKIKQA